jgi:hypothetical protein
MRIFLEFSRMQEKQNIYLKYENFLEFLEFVEILEKSGYF